MHVPSRLKPAARAFAPALLLSLLTCARPGDVAAGTFTYNPGGGPTGVWDTTTTNWLNGATSVLWPNTAADSAIFGGAGGVSVTLQTGGITAKDLTFATDGYSFTGGTLTLGGAATSTVTLNAGVNATFGNVLTGGFTKAGTGTLTLSGVNTFSNGLTVNAGTISAAADNNLGATASTLTLNGGALATSATFSLAAGRGVVLGANNGTLTAAAGTTLTAAGVISGVGGLTANGPGTLVLSGTNTFAGGLTLSGGGTLRVGADANLGAAGGTVTIANGATFAPNSAAFSTARPVSISSGAVLDVASTNTLTLSGAVTGSGGLTKNNTGTLTLSGVTNTYTGGTVVNGGTLIITADGNLGNTSGSLTLSNAVLQDSTGVTLARPLVLNAGSSESVASNKNLTASGVVSGSGGITKTGTGSLILANSGNTFTGGITVNAGTVSVVVDADLGNAANALTLAGGTLQTTGSFTLGAGRVVALGASGGTFNVNSGTTLTINTAIAGSSLTKISTGGLTLGGTNTYTGGTTVTGGTLNISSDTNLGATTGVLTLNGGVLTPVTNSVTLDPARNVAVTGNSTISPGGALGLTIPGVLSGNATLTKSGTGFLTLSGNSNTFSGATSVTAGTLNVTGINGINGSLVNSGGTVAISGSLATLTSFTNNSGTASFASGASAFGGAVSVNGGSVTLTAPSGTPAGSGALNLATGGTLLYAPTGTGATATITAATAAGARLAYNTGGGVLAIDKGSYTTGVALTLGPTGAAVDTSLIRVGTGTLILAPVDPTPGNATANLGVNEGIFVNGGLTNTNGIVSPTIVVQNNNAQKSADFVRDAGGGTGLTSAASGYTNTATSFFTISGTTAVENVTYAGTTGLAGSAQVYALRVGNGGTGTATTLTISSNSTLTVGTGAGLAGILLNGTGTTGAATINGSGTLAFGGAEGVVYVGSPGGVISSNLTGTGGLTIFGAGGINGTLALSSATGLTGPINVNTGVNLSLTAANTLPASVTVNLNTGSLNLNGLAETFAGLTGTGGVNLGTTTGVLTLNLAGSNTYSGVISGTNASNVVKQGSGSLILTGTSTYAGGTTISAGTVQLSGSNGRLPNGGNVNITSGAFLDLNTQSQTLGTLTGPGTVNSLAGGTPTLTVANNNATFSQDTVVTGPVNYTKAGTGTVTLTAANTYTGSTTITGGTLQLGAGVTLPATTILTVGATSAATFDLNGNNQALTGFAAAAGGTSKLVTNTAPNSAVTLTVNATATGTYAGNLTDGNVTSTLALVKASTGNLILTGGTNTYTGGTTVSGGTLTGNTASLQGAITNNAAVVFDQSANGTYAGAMTGSGTLTKQNAGVLTLTGANAYTGGTTVTAGTLLGTTDSLKGNITNNAALVFDQTANGTYAGNLAGNGTVTKQNTGTVTLTGTNTYTGTLVAAGGTLQVGSATAIPAGSTLTVGATGGSTPATFDVNGNSVTVAALNSGTTTGLKTLLNNGASPATLTVNATSVASTFAGSLQNGAGVLGLTKSGSRTLTLTGSNAFSGPTIINGGILQANAFKALAGSAAITVNSGGTLEAAAAGSVSGTGTITVNNGGTLLLSGTGTTDAVDNAAPVVLAGGTLAKGAGIREGTGGSSGGTLSTAGLGALTLTATGSHLDFGVGSGGTLVLAGFASGGFSLAVDNWSGTARTEGLEGTDDRLIVNQLLNATDLNNIAFAGFTPGALEIPLAGGYYEVVPVPEPATWAAGALSAAMLGWTLRRRRRQRRD